MGGGIDASGPVGHRARRRDWTRTSLRRSVMDAVRHLSFVQVIALFPIAVTLHILEEWPRFPRWARRFGSARYSDREYLVTHAFAVIIAAIAVILVPAFPRQPLISFAFFALVFGPGVFWNAWFHTGAALLTRQYCPGVVTSITVYLPLSVLIVTLAVREGLYAPGFLFVTIAVAAIVHVVEVGHTVFKRW
jgi:uncharacterized protein with HXXEE motif